MFKIINKAKAEKGFSLLELAVAVGIAAIVAVVGVTASTAFVDGSQTTSENYAASANAEILNANASFDEVWDGQQPPSAPLDVAVSGITFSAATVTWKPPAASAGSGDVESYQVRLNGDVITTLEPNILTYAFTNLSYSASYTVTVTAVNPIGATTSPTATFNTTARPVAAPFMPLGVNVSDITANTATVSWSAPASQGDNTIDRAVANYEVRVNEALVTAVDASTFSVNLTGLTYSTAYSVTVTSVNTAGSAATLPVNFATTARPIAAPNTATNATISNITSTGATVTWVAPVNQGDNTTDRTVASYDIFVNDVFNKNVSAATLSTPITGLTNTTAYEVKVYAVSSNELKSQATSATFTTAYQPMIATGGNSVYNITQNGVTYRVHEFTTVGTSSFNVSSLGETNGAVEYLVIAGGGGMSAGQHVNGGGGAGGYRSNVVGGNSGGGANAESALNLTSGSNYTVVVGAGGTTNVKGSNSVFHNITSQGGGSNSTGGSGSGASGGVNHHNDWYGSPYAGTAGQGYGGGNRHQNHHGDMNGGGGGGAGGAGSLTTGGAGVSSSITGSAVTRARGGNAGAGGGGGVAAVGTKGGDGIVIVRYPITK